MNDDVVPAEAPAWFCPRCERTVTIREQVETCAFCAERASEPLIRAYGMLTRADRGVDCE